MWNFISRLRGAIRFASTGLSGGERLDGGRARPLSPARIRPQMSSEQVEFARWERAENRFRRERRRVWWLAQHGIEAGPSPVFGVVVW